MVFERHALGDGCTANLSTRPLRGLMIVRTSRDGADRQHCLTNDPSYKKNADTKENGSLSSESGCVAGKVVKGSWAGMIKRSIQYTKY